MHLSNTVRAAIVLGLVGCGGTGPSNQQFMNTNSSLGSSKPAVTLLLTDAPNDDLSAVYVNVKHAELRVAGGGKEARLIVAEGLGAVDLLKLQNGVTLPMANVQLPAGVVITQIRLILNPTGNYLINASEQSCQLRTPSAQQTGVKLLIHGGVPVENGFNYTLVADFDAKKSVVQLGNGGCLLKPVIKLKSATKVAQTPPPASDPAPAPTPAPTPAPAPNPGAELPPGDVVTTLPIDGDNAGDASGFDNTSEGAQPPVIPEAELDQFFGDIIL